ncbi:XRE family transcriptional regulator [Streptomyces sp. SH5]|uniref:XRE family transcriptional regulator n=1 Tax=Streptomyces sp. SH5 TaxID=3041765 RepID=UPI002477D31D|nr:XRE family transcriptional regulator [Streptomyces sp. SH5]WGP14355.1 XRE family transcriptional regulator [Streptomyces sp. SH5]
MFTPERLVLARKRRRMTLAELSRESGYSAQSITAFENARKNPSEETLSSLAAALRFPQSFFHAPPAPDMVPGAVSFRAPSKMSAAERDSALSCGSIVATLNNWLEDHFTLPAPDVPTYTDLTPEHAASQVRADWGLGEAPAPNMVHLLEAHGVRVFSLAPDCLDADAFSTTRHGTPYILLNTRKTGERGRFDAAHELGHLVLHSGTQTPRGPAAEAAADAFTSAFLMPKAGTLAQQVNNASAERILSAKRRWGVSAMAFSYRLRTLQLLSEWRFQQTTKQLAQLGYRKGEPGSTTLRENSKLISKVFEALRADKVPVADLAKAVHIYPEELNHYVFGLAPVSVRGGEQKTAPARPGLTLVR